MTLNAFLSVMLGCAFGGMARHWLGRLVGRRVGTGFPWGTLAVNVTGAAAIGLLAGAAGTGALATAHPDVWRFAAAGFLGSYTTVSSFSLQTLALVHDGDWLAATANVALSLGLCLPATALGLWATSLLGTGAAP